MYLNCQDCKQEFEFTDGESKFYQEKGFTPPKRCADCRAANKAKREQQENDR